jgi:CubicO group peptidase (beta-lactamase class C family)
MSHHLMSFVLRSLVLPLMFALASSILSAQAQDAAGAGGAAPGPVFSDTGPDAAEYGAAAGFAPGSLVTASQIEHLVATYSHFDGLVKSRPVRRAATPWRFKRAAEPAITYTFRSEPRTIADYLGHHPTTGLLIAKDDTILYEHYQYARTDHDRFVSQSMAKTITSMLIGIAVSEGKIKSINDPVSAYVTGLANTEYGNTPIRDLLHMSSGVAFSETYDGQDDIAKLETEILGLVLRAATGQPVADYLHDRIWDAIGTEADASWAIDSTGQETTFCCFNATLRDYARFGRLLAHDGAWEGRQLIPRQWLLDATTVSPASPYLAPHVATPYFGYGYQVWLLPGEPRSFVLLGIRGQMILVDPASGLVMVHTAVFKKPAEDGALAEPLALWRAVIAQLGK